MKGYDDKQKRDKIVIEKRVAEEAEKKKKKWLKEEQRTCCDSIFVSHIWLCTVSKQ